MTTKKKLKYLLKRIERLEDGMSQIFKQKEDCIGFRMTATPDEDDDDDCNHGDEQEDEL